MNSYYPSSAPRPKINGNRNQSMIEIDVFLLIELSNIYPASSKQTMSHETSPNVELLAKAYHQ